MKMISQLFPQKRLECFSQLNESGTARGAENSSEFPQFAAGARQLAADRGPPRSSQANFVMKVRVCWVWYIGGTTTLGHLQVWQPTECNERRTGMTGL